MKFFNEEGKLSKTIILGVVQVLIAVLLAAATWIQAGDFSTASILVFVSGVLTIILRHYTNSPLV